MSQRFELQTTASALDIYRVLRRSNPSPYMYLVRLDGFDIVGSSPEALVKVTDNKVILHPIAGTRRRGATPEEDHALEEELRADAKERAEHLMLVDLGRNDVGRVCAPGTVEVVDFMDVRRYSHVMHLESTVTGQLAAGKTAFDALTAAFPAGTLSGAPKPRAMEIIDKLEVTRRGVYGGVVGYLDFAGDVDTAIAIRTAVLRGYDGVRAGRRGHRRRLRPGRRGRGVPDQGGRRPERDRGRGNVQRRMKPQRLVDLLAVVALVLLGLSAYLTWSTAAPGQRASECGLQRVHRDQGTGDAGARRRWSRSSLRNSPVQRCVACWPRWCC